MTRPLPVKTPDGFLLHECASPMPNLPVGRFTRIPGDERIFALACGFPSRGRPGRVLVSYDGGDTWHPLAPFANDGSLAPTDSGAFAGTANGVLVAAFANSAEQTKWAWDPERRDAPGAELPTYAVRSLDGGETWQDLRLLHRDWTGANRDLIQTRTGRLVLSSMKLLHHPGRHGVQTYVSDDDGATWQAGDLIDIGGNGHHDGATEATLVERTDGRLLMYIRTTWGQFWRALSADGMRWHVYGPAGIDASNAPGFLERLSDGRIALVWNRRGPADGGPFPVHGGDGDWSATPASNFRRELSICFSDDDGDSWSPPVVVAGVEEGEVSYPYLFEPSPGVLWITAGRFDLRLRVRVEDLER